MRKRTRVRERGQWVTDKELHSRAFNKRAVLFLTGAFLPAYQRKKLEFKKMTARICKSTTTTVHIRHI